jgi:integrase/recombinase XerD
VYLATERGLAQNSIEAYRRDLTDLALWLERHRAKALRTADNLDFREYLQDLSRAGQSSKTVARRIAALRAFVKYLQIEGVDRTKEIELLERPKPPRDLPKVLTRGQLERLLSVPDVGDPMQDRDRAILELLYASGLRATEVCTLKVGNVNLTAQAVRVIGKGSKERIVPMGKPARDALERYLSGTRPKLDKGLSAGREVVFLSKTGRALERVALWQIVKRNAERAGLAKELHPHVLRHCFASHLVEGGADLRVVQELLGHADIATTQIYTHVDSKRLKRVHREHHPRG